VQRSPTLAARKGSIGGAGAFSRLVDPARRRLRSAPDYAVPQAPF